MVQSRFHTLECGNDIIRQLYLKNPGTKLFEVTLLVQVSSENVVEEVPLTILVERLGETPPTYIHPNGDRVFETNAFFAGNNIPIKISITPPIGESDVAGATVRVSHEIERHV